MILFIDFLGFKAVVGTTASDPAALAHLIDALNEIGSMGDLPAFLSQSVTQFSDLVVVASALDTQIEKAIGS